MWRWEDVKKVDRPPLLEEPFRSDALGKKNVRRTWALTRFVIRIWFAHSCTQNLCGKPFCILVQKALCCRKQGCGSRTNHSTRPRLILYRHWGGMRPILWEEQGWQSLVAHCGVTNSWFPDAQLCDINKGWPNLVCNENLVAGRTIVESVLSPLHFLCGQWQGLGPVFYGKRTVRKPVVKIANKTWLPDCFVGKILLLESGCRPFVRRVWMLNRSVRRIWLPQNFVRNFFVKPFCRDLVASRHWGGMRPMLWYKKRDA